MGRGRRETGGRSREGDNGREGPTRDPDGRQKGGWAGGENTGPRGGDVTGDGKFRRRRGERTYADPFRYLKYPERTEWRVGIGSEVDGAIIYGCEGIPGDQNDGRHLHKEIGRVQGR